MAGCFLNTERDCSKECKANVKGECVLLQTGVTFVTTHAQQTEIMKDVFEAMMGVTKEMMALMKTQMKAMEAAEASTEFPTDDLDS